MAPIPPDSRVLIVECADRPGLVHGITGVLFRHGVNVVGNQEFVDRPTSRFFMRTEFDGTVEGERIVEELRRLLPEGAEIRLSRMEPKRVVILATREHHCLADVLIRHAYSEINARLLAVISNHAILEPLVRRFDLPFHCVPHDGLDRESHEQAVLRAIEPYAPDYLVLAKYMRILSPDFIGRFPSRIINIHHSFLPAFVGARPYHQAFERGVKVIGATAHFVTEKLDEGPIIVQQVIPVDHTHSAGDLQQAGRDVEQAVLSRAVRLVFENRVFLCGNRTVVLD
jgi:formyltetrahydrofolate deformylase